MPATPSLKKRSSSSVNVHVDTSFHSMHYFILSISKNHAQLFEVTGDRILPRGVDGMPTSMADAWKGLERTEPSLQFHSTGGGNVMGANFHGSGGVGDLVEQEEDKYIHDLANSVHTLLHGQRDPLVLACVTEFYGMFKKFDQSGRLLEEYIQGSPDQTPMEELKAKADPIVRAHVLKENEKVLEDFGAMHGTGRTSIDPVEIEAQANAGKVQTLILPEGTEGEHQTLAREVWKHRGAAVIVEAAKMPEDAPMAAILRL